LQRLLTAFRDSASVSGAIYVAGPGTNALETLIAPDLAGR